MKRIRFVSVHEMLSLDPNSRLADSSSATPLLKLVCPNLVRFDHNMRIQPELAASWTILRDHRTFRFKLRPRLRFHSGRPITAERIVWNYERLFDSRVGSLLAKDYEGLEKIRAVSRNEVEFRFAEPFPAFLHHIAFRTHVADDCQTQPVGAGPFQVVDWVRGSRLKLRRFKEYFLPGLPRADEVIVRWAPQAQQRIEMIENGEVDVVEIVPGGAAADLEKRGLLETAIAPSTRKLHLMFNCKEPPFSDRRMRLAVAHAVDRDNIVTTFLGSSGRKTDTVYGQEKPWGVAVDPIAHDLEKARAMVREAGYAQGVTVKTITTNVAPVPRIAETVVKDLAQIGIKLDVRGYDDPPWWPLIILDTHWQAAFQGMGTRPHPDFVFRREYLTGGAFNPTGYSNPELDRLVARARQSTKDAEQVALYQQAQKIVYADLPTLPLYSMDILGGWRPGVRGYRPHPLQYWDLAETTVGKR